MEKSGTDFSQLQQASNSSSGSRTPWDVLSTMPVQPTDHQIRASSPTPSGLNPSGSISTPELASHTPTLSRRHKRYSVLCASSLSRNLYSLARVTVSICIGPYEKLWRLKIGSGIRRGSNYFAIVQTWKLMGLELRICRRYSEHPEPTTESMESIDL